MGKLSATQKKFLVEATSAYHASLLGSPAEEYLAKDRGLLVPSVAEEVGKFRLGYVSDPLPGHEPFRGMLVIPYLRKSSISGWSVATLRFRCIKEGCDHSNHIGGKYCNTPGHQPRLFNTPAILLDTDTIAICEGEIDAITASVCGVHAVGVPGTESWQPHFKEAFLGYEKVFILADNDDAGQGIKFAAFVAEKLPNGVIIPAMRGHDVNSMVKEHGKRALLERIEKK